MAKITDAISHISKEDKGFVGTITFKSEEITLPNGSVMALGIDCERWVLIYQSEKGAQFVVYEYDSQKNALHVDKKAGNKQDYLEMKRLVSYFFSHAHTEDLVTILPS